MTTPATTVTECIEFGPSYVALVSYGGDNALLTQMNLWIAGIFGPAGIFPTSASNNADARKITNWYIQHLIARDEIEGPAIGDSGVVSTSDCINAIERVLYAILEGASTAQKAAVVALFNTVWAVPAATVAATLHTTTAMAPAVNVTNGGPAVHWNAILTWSRLGLIGNGKLLVYVQTPRAPDLEVRDNQRYSVGLGGWVAEPGTVGVVNGNLAVVTVAAIEAAINGVSLLCQVTTADAAHAAYKGSAGVLTSVGSFSGGS